MNKTKDQFEWVEWMIRERTRKGWSQADLARKADVTRTTISDYEKRIRTKPDIEILWRISVALDHPDDYLPRLAGLLPAKEDPDPWATKMAQMSSQLSPGLREVTERFINSMVEGEETGSRKAKARPKPKSSTSS